MSFNNPLKKIWADGKSAVNGWIDIPSVLSAEVMARAGWDSVTIDMQHGTADYSDLLTMLPVINQTDTAALVRVPCNPPRGHHASSRRRCPRHHCTGIVTLTFLSQNIEFYQNACR
jgi:2-keto-3-deoxy-L-rhamnonate aldolase RhmA